MDNRPTAGTGLALRCLAEKNFLLELGNKQPGQRDRLDRLLTARHISIGFRDSVSPVAGRKNEGYLALAESVCNRVSSLIAQIEIQNGSV